MCVFVITYAASIVQCQMLNGNKQCLFANGLLQTTNLVKQIEITGKLLHNFSVFLNVAKNILQDHMELVNYEAVSLKYYEYVSVFLP